MKLDIKDKITRYVKDYVKDAFIPYQNHPGRRLKKDLNLNLFSYVWIRKIINLPMDFYIVTYDSRFPGTYIPRFKLKDVSTSSIKNIKKRGGVNTFKLYKMTPAVDLMDFEGKIKNGIIMCQDLAGEKFVDQKMFESKNGLLNRIYD